MRGGAGYLSRLANLIAAVDDWVGQPIAILGITSPRLRMRRNRYPFYRQGILCSRPAAAALGYHPAASAIDASS
jgi:hypothetical protein